MGATRHWHLLSESSPSLTSVRGRLACAFTSCLLAAMVSTVAPNDRAACVEKSLVNDLVLSSFPLISDAAAIAKAQARDDLTCQLRRPASMLSLVLDSSTSRPTETDILLQLDGNTKHKPRRSSCFYIRERQSPRPDLALHGDAHK